MTTPAKTTSKSAAALTPLFRVIDGAIKTARLMVGMPDYDAYVAHRQSAHPGEPVMSYDEFFRERQSSRYGEGENGGRISRCC